MHERVGEVPRATDDQEHVPYRLLIPDQVAPALEPPRRAQLPIDDVLVARRARGDQRRAEQREQDADALFRSAHASSDSRAYPARVVVG
jgi:hypothetical protein